MKRALVLAVGLLGGSCGKSNCCTRLVEFASHTYESRFTPDGGATRVVNVEATNAGATVTYTVDGHVIVARYKNPLTSL